MRTSSALTLAAFALAPSIGRAATYRVGTSAAAQYRQLSQLPRLAPGDLVELEGGATYAGGFRFTAAGSQDARIVVRGVGGGGRPRIAGGADTIEAAGDHYVFENLDLSGGASRCFFHHAHDVTLRDSVVHDCPSQGILGADNDSGSLLLERVEVHRCGAGDRSHQIYMATDEVAHPGAVFRMQGCWVHDATGGNSVKSRAERNEIYGNWIEGGFYHELELIGVDPAGGVPEAEAREDADVVGNVFVKRGSNERFAVVRFGGDATGQSWGRCRFAFNTVLVAPGSTAAVFRLFDGLESVEMHGNVFAMRGGGPVNLLREAEADWANGRAVAGTDNWVSAGSSNVPPEWTGTVSGADPGLVELDDLGGLDLRPADASSPVVDTGRAPPPAFSAHPFPGPLGVPAVSPIHGVGTLARAVVGAIDRGAYELGAAPPDPGGDPPGVEGSGCATGGAAGAGALLALAVLLRRMLRPAPHAARTSVPRR
jgi:hypothetical protein